MKNIQKEINTMNTLPIPLSQAQIVSPAKAGELLKDASAAKDASGLSEGDASQADTKDTITITAGNVKEQKSFKDKLSSWIKHKVDEQNQPLTTGRAIGNIVRDTLIGAAGGAAVIAIGASPAAMGIASAVIGGAVLGLVGTGVGAFVGFLIGGAKNSSDGASSGAKMGAAIGGLGLGSLGAVTGYASGAIETSVLVSLAAHLGGGPLGGAVGGAIISGVLSGLSNLRKLDRDEHKQEQANKPPPLQP